MYPEYQLPNIEKEVSQDQMDKYLAYYKEHKKQLILAAIQASQNGYSYRKVPFKVGCSLLTVGKDSEPDEYPVYFAYNFKPEPGDVKGWDKRCAERNAIQSALEHNTEVIVAIVTASTETSTGDATKAHEALHPCEERQKLFKDLLQNGVLKKDSIVCNTNHSNPSDIKTEERTVEELLRLYEK